MQNKPDLRQAKEAVRVLMSALRIPEDGNTKNTPERVARAMAELCRGLYDGNFEKEVVTFPIGEYKGMVVQAPIKTYSLCSHHLMPIRYQISFGYIPRERGVGFSKIKRIIDKIAAKPMTQEEFTQEVVDTFQELLEPKGLGLVVRGWHDCITVRKEWDYPTVTSAIKGTFKSNPETRGEFYKHLDQ